MYIQPATILVYCCLSQENSQEISVYLPSPPLTPHLSSTHSNQAFLPTTPTEIALTKISNYLLFSKAHWQLSLWSYSSSQLYLVWLSMFSLNLILHWTICLPFLGFPSAIPDTPQTYVGSASSTNLRMLPYPQDSSLNLTFLPKKSHAFLWLQIPSTHW